LIEETKRRAPPEWAAMDHQTEEDAQIGIAFHRRDYDEFARLAQQVSRENPRSAAAAAEVASAYACKYAVTGDPSMRQAALDSLEQARKLKRPNDAGFPEYENRIQHRLATRMILSRAQFVQQYPNGWKGN
jgi:ADP-ribosylglycohydrolase